jgi:hypothetical protein
VPPRRHAARGPRAVIDNGPGVDPKIAARIFRPFVTTRARGTGLGLALVQKIVVTHNGRVTVQPEPGGGTRFSLVLPLAEDGGRGRKAALARALHNAVPCSDLHRADSRSWKSSSRWGCSSPSRPVARSCSRSRSGRASRRASSWRCPSHHREKSTNWPSASRTTPFRRRRAGALDRAIDGYSDVTVEGGVSLQRRWLIAPVGAGTATTVVIVVRVVPVAVRAAPELEVATIREARVP